MRLRALFDTGFSGTLFLSAAAADKASVPRDPKTVRGPAFGQEVGGVGPARRLDLNLLLEAFELGPLRFRGVWAQVQMKPDAEDARRSFEALVGTGVLLPFPRVGIDTDRAVLEFELPPGVRPGRDGSVEVPSLGAFAGAMFVATDLDRPAGVRGVMPGSPADRAGLRAGDLVLTLGGEVVASQDLASVLRRTWLRPGAELVLDVMAAGATEPRRIVVRP